MFGSVFICRIFTPVITTNRNDMTTTNNLTTTLIELDQERSIETIDTNSFTDCKQTIEGHSSFNGNYNDYYFVVKDENDEVVKTVTLDFENEIVTIS